MDESALKALIDSLQGSRASLDFWLNLCSALVAVGVVLEVAFILREYYCDLLDWRCGLVHPPERPSKLWLLFELFGVALVTVGVAGEFLIDVKAGSLETQIRNANEKLVLILEQEAGTASKSATKAAIDASLAEGIADRAKEIAHEAQKKADSSERDIVSAKRQTTDAESHLADAMERTARLEQQLSWRTVTPEQKEKFRMQLFASQHLLPLRNLIIDIAYENQNPEAEEFACELKDAMDGLGADISDLNGMSIFGPKTVQGVIVTANPLRNSQATSLLVALQIAGFPVLGKRNNNMDEHNVSIMVGSKPRVTAGAGSIKGDVK
jgi:hypothetical protein